MTGDVNGGRSAAYLDGESPLRVADAVAAILLTETGDYLLQLRDDKPTIFFPNHWGCFGGALEQDESHEAALTRELEEEIGLSIPENRMRRFTAMWFDFSIYGQPPIHRWFFEVRLASDELDAVKLGEGRAVDSFAGRTLLRDLTITPYDQFALWMHISRHRLS